MDHAVCREWLELYLVDGLSKGQEEEMREHLDNCPECAREEAELRRMLFELAALNDDVEAPEGLLTGVMEKIRLEEGAKKRSSASGGKRRTWWTPGKIVGTAVAGFAILFVSGAVLLSSLGARNGEMMKLAGENNFYGERGTGGAYSVESAAMPLPSAAPEEAPQVAMDGAKTDGLASSAGSASAEMQEYGEKIIRTASLSVDSDAFDEDLQSFLSAVSECGGHVTSQDVSGSKLEVNQYGAGRYLYLQIRVPEENLDSFLGTANRIGVTRSSSVNEQDITSQYYDTQRRLDGYKAQHTRILELMEKAATVEDLISIESELTRLNYEIDSLTGNLNYWDSQVSYSTVYVDMQEVKRAESVNPSLTERMRNALQNTFDSIREGSKNFVVGLYGSLPYIGMIIVLGAAVWLVVFLVVRSRKKKRAK